MKPRTPIPLIVTFLIAMNAGVHLSAQTVELIAVEKISNFVQNKDGVFQRPFDQPNQSFPYQFRIDVEGAGLGSLATPTFAIPGGSYTAATGDPLGQYQLVLDGGEWGRLFNFGVKSSLTGGPPGGTGAGGLDGLFHNGLYTVTVDGEPVSLQLGGGGEVDVYPDASNPTVSAGTWDAGGISRLYHNVNNPLTINTGTFANFGTGVVVSGLSLFISREGSDVVDKFSLSSDLLGLGLSGGNYADFLEHTFAANTMVSGSEYYVSIEFFNLTDAYQVAGLDGALAIGLFTSRTEFTISVVPEPSTYAAIAGALALVGVMLVRRRRA